MKLLTSERLLYRVATLLYQVAQFSRRTGLAPAKSNPPYHVVHVSPAYFSEDSLIGGGERYATNLARATANHLEATLISFGTKRRSLQFENLKVEVYPVLDWLRGLQYDPLCYTFLKELSKADIIHCHQYKTAVTNLAILVGAALGKRIFVTDYGGVGQHFTEIFPMTEYIHGFLPISAFSAQLLPAVKQGQILYGGVDEEFVGRSGEKTDKKNILFVGRLLPHKGINYLIEAIEGDMCLEVVGRVYHEDYFKLLQNLAEGKNVHFITDADEEMLGEVYQRALVTVLPSVYTDVYGNQHALAELLGLVLLEGMASGAAVICTNVGAMPELVSDGVTGFVVPPNDPFTLRERLRYLLNNRDVALEMGQQGRQKVLVNFNWDAVARRCLQAYQG